METAGVLFFCCAVSVLAGAVWTYALLRVRDYPQKLIEESYMTNMKILARINDSLRGTLDAHDKRWVDVLLWLKQEQASVLRGRGKPSGNGRHYVPQDAPLFDSSGDSGSAGIPAEDV